MRVRALVRIACLSAAVARAPPLWRLVHAQQPSVTFQVEVNYVDIDALVTDERGNFVEGLTKEDFELFDDGRPQDIDAFSVVNIPLPSATARTMARTQGTSDVRTNADPITGRLYVIVLDDLNVSPLRGKVVVNSA